ncbi:copper homeostasis protein CutC [Lysinibacter cavernae]|uniref:PF03932 family protein CutC n=1 Tax=Lysinibacter cavernae TaxID=1640652 RepID=A0A7X5R295_9MICO|nr:copper homeostasis protein CutC [Lysinibacter cavernae]NIH54344.1 copper homeostasis protein [Lysinibacter cavernae]
MSHTIEIAVQDVAGARATLEAGAQRVEVCSALITGGLTPSIGTIEAIVEAAREADARNFVHVLVRPRPGGFVYDADEIRTQVRDIRAAIMAGANGVVVGALSPNGEVDRVATEQFVAAAQGLEVTFHRAIDASANPIDEIDTLADLGVTRILSSGQAARSRDGIPVLQEMVHRAAGRIQIMAGGGVTVEAIPALFSAGVDAVHLSARHTVGATDPSGPGGGGVGHDATDAKLVRYAVEAAG